MGTPPVTADEGSVHEIPDVRVVRDKWFLGIVAERQWNALQAADQLKVIEFEVQPPFSVKRPLSWVGPEGALASPGNPTTSPTSFWPRRQSRRCSTASRHCLPRTCATRLARRSSRAKRSNIDLDCFVAFGSSQLTFRLRYPKGPRDIAVVKAAAKRMGW